MKNLVRSLLLLAILFVSIGALGQSCALCYTQAASSGPKMINALRHGIIILMVPPFCICLLLTNLAYRKRNLFRSSQPQKVESVNAHLGW